MKQWSQQQKERALKTTEYIYLLADIQQVSVQLVELGLTEDEFNAFVQQSPTAVAVDEQLEAFYTEGIEVSGVCKLVDLRIYKEVLRDLLGTKLAEREIA
jgi:hypothetical protein|uniref:Uncharacterized protein n=1 Tax=Myoviridae sp. ctYA416 TaxID=2825125 RepID=A0A8S5UTJ3_9CAUD|nr:MAG TPA: hypothetical protein [Myoviridae sp. ctYA416]